MPFTLPAPTTNVNGWAPIWANFLAIVSALNTPAVPPASPPITSGSGNWTSSSTTTAIKIVGSGPGGQGGSGNNEGGGGAGEFGEYFVSVSPNTSYSYVIGVQGSGNPTTITINGVVYSFAAGGNGSG